MKSIAASLILALAGCDKLSHAREAIKAASVEAPGPLTETYSTQNRLLALHYPAAFAAKSTSEMVVVIARNFGDGSDEALTFAAIPKPISDDPKEFSRVFDTRMNAQRPHFHESSRTEVDYRGGHGFVTVGAWTGASGRSYFVHGWTFVREGHGYHFSYSYPESRAATEEKVMNSIIAATEFTEASPSAGSK